MIRYDRKTCKDILKLTDKYDDLVIFDPDIGGYCNFDSDNQEEAEVKPSIPVSEVTGALHRLEERGMIKKISGTWSGGMVFSITPELLHAKAFWWDRFSKRFLGGFVSGLVVGITANLLTGYVQSALSTLIQWLLSHI